MRDRTVDADGRTWPTGYSRALPAVFPVVVRMPHEEVRAWVAFLLSELRTDVPQGSSFAVTVDNWDGTWNLWLSEVSLRALCTKGCPAALAVARFGSRESEMDT